MQQGPNTKSRVVESPNGLQDHNLLVGALGIYDWVGKKHHTLTGNHGLYALTGGEMLRVNGNI